MIQDLLLGARDALLISPMMQRMAADWRNTASFEAARLEEFPWVERERLAFYEQEFKALGFEPCGDWTLKSSFSGLSGFMRLMGHATEKAHASLHTTKPAASAPTPLRCAINAPLSEGWVMVGTDREADSILYQLRPSRAVALRDCDAHPVVLWRETLQIRAQLMEELNLHPVGTGSAEDFMALSGRMNAERADLVLKQNPLRFAIKRRALMRDKPPRRALWTGEWKPKKPLNELPCEV